VHNHQPPASIWQRPQHLLSSYLINLHLLDSYISTHQPLNNPSDLSAKEEIQNRVNAEGSIRERQQSWRTVYGLLYELMIDDQIKIR
jgi:hypothetical protein